MRKRKINKKEDPMIHFMTVWSNSKNIGKEYNNRMEGIPEGDWGCFIDGDAMFSTKYWGTQLYDIIKKYPDAGCLTAMTNRVNNKAQCHIKKLDRNMDMAHQRKIGSFLQETRYDMTVPLKKSQPMSGVLMLVSKEVWKRVKFREREKLAGIDNYFHF